jgi:hypothetical protein
LDQQTFWFGVATSLVAALIWAALAALTGSVSPRTWHLLKNISLLRRFRVAGLTNFYASRDQFQKYRRAARLVDYLGTANESIVIVGHWMAQGVEMEGVAQSIAGMVQPPRGLRVTLALIDPTGPAIPDIASYWDLSDSELRLRIQSALAKLWSERSKLSSNELARYELKVYRTVPVASVIILDNKRLQIDVKPYKVARQSSFAFEFTGPGHPLFDLCRTAFTRMASDAVPFDPERHLAGFSEEQKH